MTTQPDTPSEALRVGAMIVLAVIGVVAVALIIGAILVAFSS